MTYFPDLSPYTSTREDGAEADLCVGWLSSKRSYPKRRPDAQLVNALLRCCLRPARLSRGFHVCDLCFLWFLPRRTTYKYDGRDVRLGNGEIRVKGPDGQTYTAPTLVAHYVAAHRYAPPAPFVEGVMRRAREIYVLRGKALKRIKALEVTERYDLCLDALRALQAQHPTDWLADAIPAIEAAKPALDPAARTSYETELGRLDSILFDRYVEAADDPVRAAVHRVQQFFVYAKLGAWYARKVTLELTADALDRVHEAGLTEWRSDLRPSRFDEPK